MRRTLLIAEDKKINREILKNMLREDYDIIEAEHGNEALEIMAREYHSISAVLLDLGMPVMDGFEVLRCMHADKKLSQLPVIVATGQTDSDSEEKALILGANDYITKPYKSAIIKQRIANTINLRETAATVNALQRDRLTGLYSRDAFFDKVSIMAAQHEPGYYIMACFDIENFKVINDQYGTEKGDEVLRHVADIFSKNFESIGGICCRIAADDFAVLYPSSFLHSDELANIRRSACEIRGLLVPISYYVGRYAVSDIAMSPSAMYDRTMMAASSVRGRYDTRIAEYDESMRDRLLHEQEIVTEMETALRNNQFEIWYQPQYNHSTGAIIGAEALARWRHPKKGMLISPGIFIPLFEQNGFIYELDKYVWRGACRYLQEELEAGNSPVPISVNISRYDIFRGDFIDYIKGLVKEYNIPVELLRLEVTESAFSESTTHIVAVVKELIDYGFTLEIDDFGSGYSSLNTLKSVPAQVVKLDMRFLEDDDNSDRGGNIIESIVRMTKWLGMSVIAEGVEKKSQADFLKSIGCNYVQGYLYAKPMAQDDYREFCRDGCKENKLFALETVENLDNNSFWDPKSMDTLIFNSYVGAACIYEYCQGKVELLRTTDKYAQMIGNCNLTVDDVLKIDFVGHLNEESRRRLFSDIDTSVRTKKEVVGEYVFLDLPNCPYETYLRITMRVIATAGNRYLVYCINENITPQRVAECHRREMMSELNTMMDDIPGGFTRIRIYEDGSLKPVFVNEGLCQISGMTRDEVLEMFSKETLAGVHPDDKPIVMNAIQKMIVNGEAHSSCYRMLHKNGKYIWMNIFGRITTDESGKSYLNIYYTEVSQQVKEEQYRKELLDNISYGIALYEYDGKDLTVVHINKRYWELVNRKKTEYEGSAFVSAIYPDDRKNVLKELNLAIKEKRNMSFDLRIRYGENEYRPFHIDGRIVQKNDGRYSIYASYSSITDQQMSFHEMLPIALDAVMNAHGEYNFVKDRNLRYVCCSQQVLNLAGLSEESEIKGKSDYELFDKQLADPFYKDDMRILETGEAVIDIIDHLPPVDGMARYAGTSKFPLKDPSGKVVGVFGLGRDVTETHKLKTRLEFLTDNVPGGIASYKYKDGKISVTYLNDGICRLFEVTHDEYIKINEENPLKGIYEEYLPEIHRQIEALVKDDTQIDCIYRVKLRNGGVKWINLIASASEREKDSVAFNAMLLDVTQRCIGNEKLRISEEENRLAIRHTSNIVCRYDVESKSLYIPENTKKEFMLSEIIKNVPDSQIESKMISHDTAKSYAAFYKKIFSGEKTGVATYQRLSKKGWRWIEGHFSTIFSQEGKPVSAVISFADITDRIEKDAIYKRWKHSFKNKAPQSYSLFKYNLTTETYYDERDGSLICVDFDPNSFGFSALTEKYVARYVSDDDADRFVEFMNADKLLSEYYRGKHCIAVEYREKLPQGKDRWIRLTVDMVEIAGSHDVEAYMMFEDIDEAKRQELETRRQAETDPLTGVLNRITFAKRVNEAIESSKPGEQHALLMLDVDSFKMVNDTYGHETGDNALIEITKKVATVLHGDDMLGRLGGDEFVIFMRDVPSEEIVAERTKKICSLMRRKYSEEVEISGSIGVTIVPRDGEDFKTLYKKVDVALYHVKDTGKDSYVFYADDMTDRRLTLSKPPTDSTGSAHTKRKQRMQIVDEKNLRVRAQAISKADNERLRAKNSTLEFRSGEITRYKSALNASGAVVIENDWVEGTFVYDPKISKYIGGTFDNRGLWHILLSDFIADTQTVQQMQWILQDIASDREKITNVTYVRLKTPQNVSHWFKMNVLKKVNDLGLAGKIYMTFIDMGEKKPTNAN